MHKKVKYEDTSGGSRKFAYAKYFDQLENMDENFRKEVSAFSSLSETSPLCSIRVSEFSHISTSIRSDDDSVNVSTTG